MKMFGMIIIIITLEMRDTSSGGYLLLVLMRRDTTFLLVFQSTNSTGQRDKRNQRQKLNKERQSWTSLSTSLLLFPSDCLILRWTLSLFGNSSFSFVLSFFVSLEIKMREEEMSGQEDNPRETSSVLLK